MTAEIKFVGIVNGLSAIQMKIYRNACPRACSALAVLSIEVKKQLQYSTLSTSYRRERVNSSLNLIQAIRKVIHVRAPYIGVINHSLSIQRLDFQR